MEILPTNEIYKLFDQILYLPNPGEVKDSSSTTNLRVVFDASVNSRSSLSLDDNRLVVSKLQDNLYEILWRYRKHKKLMGSFK